MRLNRLARFAMLGTLAGILLASGCTGSDPLAPGTGQIAIQVTSQNSSSRFDTSFVGLLQIEVVPVDPGSAAASGSDPVGLINSARRPGDIDFAFDGDQFIVPVTLGTGRWPIERILIDNIFFTDFDPPASQATCEEFIGTYSRPEKVRIQQFGQNVIFEVNNSGATNLTITWDGQKFLEALQASYICIPQGQFGCGQPWCLFLPGSPVFNEATLDAMASTFLEFS